MLSVESVRIRLASGPREGGPGRLLAYASAVISGGVVLREMKVIDGPSGWMVAMPSRVASARCPGCEAKVSVLARFCGDCGAAQPVGRIPTDCDGRPRVYIEMYHPINADAREAIRGAVLGAYAEELGRVEDAEREGVVHVA